jgi:hypothetical protein
VVIKQKAVLSQRNLFDGCGDLEIRAAAVTGLDLRGFKPLGDVGHQGGCREPSQEPVKESKKSRSPLAR